MPGTKILNIQKSDSFDEVFEAFSQAEAREVIFIFPKGSVIAKEPAYFEAIRQEAERSGKQVNIMTSDLLVAHLARQNGLGLLQSPAPKSRRATVVSAPAPQPEPTPEQVPEPEPELPPEVPAAFQETPASPEYPMAQEASFDTVESELIADLAMAKRVSKPTKATLTPSGKPIRDIVTQKNDGDVEIDEAPEQHVELPISRASLIPKKIADEPEPDSTPNIEKLWEQEEQRQQDTDPNNSEKPKRKFFGNISKKLIFIPVGIAVVTLGIIIFITVGHAKIILMPHAEPLDLKLTVIASSTTASVSAEFDKIPGQEFTVQKEAAGSYDLATTKEVAQKASGKITITNKSGASQRLVATTRFESPDGLIFRIPETINVPAGGSVDSTVYADRPGKEYNIAATKFTVPGLKGTPQFDTITATSADAMSGGFIGAAKIVTEQDFTKAREELTQQAKDQVVQALKEQAGELKFPDDIAIKVADPVANAKSGEAADKLEMKVSASASVIAYRESDVKLLLQSYLEKNGGLELSDKDLKITYSDTKLDIAAKTITFNVAASGTSQSKIDTDKVLLDIKGMNESAMRDYFKNQKGIASARILLSPFWVTSVPKDPKKIELVVDR